ncbi:MAG: aminopeptidase P N-terminal domain-containing protein [Pseudomonadota bacterium]
MYTLSELKQRRRQLLTAVDSNAIIILASAAEHFRNGDVYYPYRQNSDFYYLTAFPEPDAIALLLPDAQGGKCILFNRPYDPLQAIWHGESIGQEKACEQYAVDEAYAIDQLEILLPDYLVGRCHYYWLGAQDSPIVKRVNKVITSLNKVTVQQEDLVRLPDILHEMRLRKSPSELACLRQAASISSQAHGRAMQACRPGLYEYQLEAELLHAFYQEGCRASAYPSIVASGGNACILHYTDNNSVLKSGDLVLIDAGCEYQFYASDITRCFPISGQFSPEQKAIYAIVLKAQQEVIDLIKPGVVWKCLQTRCIQIITEGLLDLGLLKGEVSSLIEQKAYKKFYMHGCSHWLGLDVHDVGRYKQDKRWRPLEANMVFTVEPGIYIADQTPDIDEKWWNIGVRIEDDVRVTEDSCEVLSRVPKDILDIESLMRS